MFDDIKKKLFHPLIILGVMWAIFLLEVMLPGNIESWGIRPRTFTGLFGIATSPFIHSSIFHIIGNSIAFAILGTFVVASSSTQRFWLVTVFIAIVGGLGTWLFSGADVVIGASGLVYGFWAYLLTMAVVKRSVTAIAIGLVTLILYSGMFFSLFLVKPYISFAGHFFGALAGVAAAIVLTRISKTE